MTAIAGVEELRYKIAEDLKIERAAFQPDPDKLAALMTDQVRLEELVREIDYSHIDDSTHWAECWKGHLVCAWIHEVAMMCRRHAVEVC